MKLSVVESYGYQNTKSQNTYGYQNNYGYQNTKFTQLEGNN